MTASDISKWLHSSYYGIPVDRVIGSIAVLAIAYFVIFYFIHLLRRLFFIHQHRLHLSYETATLVIRVMRIALWIGVVFLILSLWGVSVGGLWTTIASVATIVGVGFLAVWTMISNITANLFLTVWRPFHLGAVVEILPENLSGKVVDINMMYTVLREEQGSALYVPNNMFFQKLFRVSGQSELHPYESFERQGR